MARSNSTDRSRPTSIDYSQHSTERRCTAQTRKGTRCKSKAVVYHRHTDGREYLCCNRHASFEFRPAAGIDQKEATKCSASN